MYAQTRHVDWWLTWIVMVALLSTSMFAQQLTQPTIAGISRSADSSTKFTANNTRPKANDQAPIGPLGRVWEGTATAQIVSRCSAKFSIVKPDNNSSFSLSDNNYTATDPIPFQSNGGYNSETSWHVQVSYAASTGKGDSGATKDFSSSSDGAVSEQFQSMCG